MTTRGAGALVLILSALGTSGAWADDGGSGDPFDQTFDVEPDVRVDIEIATGKIQLRGIDANEVRVHAKGPLRVKGSQRRVSLRAPSGDWRPWADSVDVELEIELPRKSRITARTINGGIEAEGVEGELELHAANGAIEVKGAPEEAYLETMNAAIKFEGKRSEVVAKTLNGEIELKGVSGEVEAHTVSGRIRVEGERLERADLRTMAGEIELHSSLAKGARISARSFSGPVKLRLPEGTSARFEVQSYSGGIQSDFVSRSDGDEDDGVDRAWGRGPGRPLSFVVGEGDARVSIESFSGGVKVERGD